MSKVHNFSAGPCILPTEAIEESINGLRDFKGSGIPVVSISHRSPQWEETMHDAEILIKELFHINDEYGIMFLQGGASMQFTMLAYNLLPVDGRAAYINTGTWSKNAIKEAKIFGNIDVIASSEDKNFSYIPKQYEVPADASYLHYTTNNTIEGTQFQTEPVSHATLVADMSSDIFSRPIDVNKYGLIYAGAQKNMGPAGCTLVIVKKDILGKSGRTIPSMLDYQLMLSKESMFNTPPVFGIYLSYLTLKWLKENGGVEAIYVKNEEKAQLLYSEIDSNPLFKGTAAVEDRSRMNVTFVMENTELEDPFLKYAEENGISGIPGHRSVGGFRASVYNALPRESVEALVHCMKEFATKNA